MEQEAKQIYQFFELFFSHWMVLTTITVPNGISWIVNCFNKRWPTHVQNFNNFFTNEKKIFIAVFFLLSSIFYASFQAWQVEFSLKNKAENSISEYLNQLKMAMPTGQQERISQLERDLGASNAKIALMNEREKPRELDKDKLISILKSAGASYETTIYHSSDLESQNFATEIADALTAAGWKINPPHFRIIKEDAAGVFISIKDIKKPGPKGGLILQRALEAVGVASNGNSFSEVPEGEFEIYVGPKTPIQ